MTFSTLFGLIAVTGLRIGEAVALNDEDFDRESGVLAIRHGKLGKERLLPLSESTRTHLAVYAGERDRLLGARPKAFFVSDRAERLTTHCAQYNFVVVCQSLGLRPAQKFHRWGRGPRIHDLRHTFAVNTLLNWYRTGKDAAAEMLRLTTYLGHAKPADTYWYIEAVPELLEIASDRACASLAKEVRA
jgi:integrase